MLTIPIYYGYLRILPLLFLSFEVDKMSSIICTVLDILLRKRRLPETVHVTAMAAEQNPIDFFGWHQKKAEEKESCTSVL